MPTNEMGHPPSSADAPPPLTSGEIEEHTKLLVRLARENIPPDVQELLVQGNPALSVRPYALWRALSSLKRTPPSTAGWLPISTAPKDGTTLLVFLPDKIIYPSGKRHADGSPFWKRKDARCMLARWTECPPDLENKLPGLRAKGLAVLKGGYWTARADGLRPLDRLPSHWMPLPPTPSQEGASEGEGSPANRGPA